MQQYTSGTHSNILTHRILSATTEGRSHQINNHYGGGGIIGYPGKLTTKRADLATFNIHISTVISIQGARYYGWDILNYYLETPMGKS